MDLQPLTTGKQLMLDYKYYGGHLVARMPKNLDCPGYAAVVKVEVRNNSAILWVNPYSRLSRRIRFPKGFKDCRNLFLAVDGTKEFYHIGRVTRGAKSLARCAVASSEPTYVY